MTNLNSHDVQAPVVVVSGLPRSGTSMLMRMLEAGGLPVLTDHLRTRDIDNPNGYYEFERVKALDKGDVAWLPEAQGKAVKVISALLPHLPADYAYRVIFVRRNMAEVLASQRKMLERRGETSTISDEQMAAIYQGHLRKIEALLAAEPHFETLYVEYGSVVTAPLAHAEQVNEFLGGVLNPANMAAAVDPSLHRNRNLSPS